MYRTTDSKKCHNEEILVPICFVLCLCSILFFQEIWIKVKVYIGPREFIITAIHLNTHKI